MILFAVLVGMVVFTVVACLLVAGGRELDNRVLHTRPPADRHHDQQEGNRR